MPKSSITSRPFLRAGVEFVVIILGVVLALAVDRWVSSQDQRAMEAAWTENLIADIRQDSLEMVRALGYFERTSSWGLAALRLIEDETRTIEDPNEFVLEVVGLGWWLPFRQHRDTWAEITATGGLGTFRDPQLRAELTNYYGFLEYINQLEARWRSVFDYYWEVEQAALSPLVRIAVLDAGFGMEAGRDITGAEAEAVLEALRRDADFRGAFATGIQIYRYGAGPFGALLGHSGNALKALEGR